jgi:hypothetical protein
LPLIAGHRPLRSWERPWPIEPSTVTGQGRRARPCSRPP